MTNNSIHEMRAQLLKKSRMLQQQFNINNQVDKLAEIQDNIVKERIRKKPLKPKRKSINAPIESTRRSKRLLGEQADLTNVDFELLETASKVSNTSARPRQIKSGNLQGDEVAESFIKIDDFEREDVKSVGVGNKSANASMRLQVVGDVYKVMKHRITVMSLHSSNLCALGDKEGNISLWNFDNLIDKSDELDIVKLNIHDANISHVSFIDKSLLSCSYANMRLTDLTTNVSDEVVAEYKISAVYATDNLVYYGGVDGKVHLRDLKSRRSSRILTEETKKVNTIDIRENHIITGGLNRKVQLYDIRNSSNALQEFEHGYSVNSAYFNSDGSQIITTSYDNYLRLFNTNSISNGPSMKRVHDCQTGKWVSKFKACFDKSDSVVYCADKSRRIMYYASKNMKLLYSTDAFTAIPAIVCTRESWTWDSEDVVLTGNGSGKCHILKGIKQAHNK
eukprot:NODE_727_length_4761_cov_0.252038.p3 type:complete len:450 gc:universal NODE_727_length_4761_cov_0.252038:1731-3080(+)